jgi:hypothetical protein
MPPGYEHDRQDKSAHEKNQRGFPGANHPEALIFDALWHGSPIGDTSRRAVQSGREYRLTRVLTIRVIRRWVFYRIRPIVQAGEGLTAAPVWNKLAAD